eukprot:1159452-Pelagomonas_calceolata.AAC.9
MGHSWALCCRMDWLDGAQVSTVLPRGLDGWAQLSTVLTAGLAGLLHFTRGVACSLCAAAFKTERAGLEAAAEANITCPLGMSARCP